MSADPDPGDTLRARWKARKAGPFFGAPFETKGLTDLLPEDYLSLVPEFGGMEGFLGTTYLRLYLLEDAFNANLAYEVPDLLPECFVFGSNGGGEAFAFVMASGQVMKVPFIPLAKEYAVQLAPTFSEFVRQRASAGEPRESTSATLGMEIHEVHPIVFGGNPTDPKNKVLVPADKHAELARFWNKVFRNSRQSPPSPH